MVFCSPSSPPRFSVDDRRSHEHNTNHLRLGDLTVWFRFDRTGREPAGDTITANKKRPRGKIRARNLRFSEISIFGRLRKKYRTKSKYMNAADDYHFETSQKELAAEILKQAAADLRRFHGATSAVEREFYLDAHRWVTSDDCSWPFSFLND